MGMSFCGPKFLAYIGKPEKPPEFIAYPGSTVRLSYSSPASWLCMSTQELSSSKVASAIAGCIPEARSFPLSTSPQLEIEHNVTGSLKQPRADHS